MLKKHKRIISYFIVCAMAFLLITPTSVNASSIQLLENPSSIDVNSNTLYSVFGEDVPTSLSNDLENMNITVEDNTLVEYVSSKNNNVADTLVVTNIDGDSMEKAFITSLTSDGTQQTYSETNEGKAWCPSPVGDSFTLVMMVEYNKFTTDLLYTYYYQPVNVLFIYYDNNNLYTVHSIVVDYQCGGYEHIINRDEYGNVTGYTPVTSGPEQYIHNITISRTSSKKNTYYSGNNPYNTNRVIDPNLGLYGSHMLFYEIYMAEAGSNDIFYVDGALGIDQIIS